MLLSASALAGCTVGPDYRPASSSELGVPAAYSTPADAVPSPELARWWGSFSDPLMGEIVEIALAQNLDIAQSAARLRQARAALIVARADRLPDVGASAGVGRTFDFRGGLGDQNSFSLGGDVAYQTGLFGDITRNIEASRADLQATGFDLATIQSAVAAEVARNYILARNAQANLAIARESLAIQDDNLEISGFRVQAGLVSSLDVEQVRAQRAQTAANIPLLEQSYQAALFRLGVLTGQAPGALRERLVAVAPVPQGPARVAAGVPADTLRLRPDVRRAERALAASTARIGVATAQLYPALTLTGSIDTSASALGALGDFIPGRLFAGLAQAIFDGGRRRANIRSAEAATDAAFAAYKGTVLAALEDVENALVAGTTATAREREFGVALDASNAAAILARSLYRAGLTDITTLNNAESALLSASNGVSNARADRAQALVQLYLALGGGWTEADLASLSAQP